MARILGFLLLAATICSGGVGAERPAPWPEGWSEISVLHTSSIQGGSIALAAGGGKTAVAWVDGSFVQELDVMFGYIDSAGKLMRAVKISKQSGNHHDPEMVIDHSGTSHIVWEEKLANGNRVHYATAKGDKVRHSILVERSRPLKDVSLALGPDRIHVLWSDQLGSSFEVYHTALGFDGSTVVEAHQVTRTGATSSIPTGAVDEDGNLHVVWAEMLHPKEKLYYLQLANDGSPIGRPQEVGTIAAEQGGGVFLDSRDGVVLVWPDYPGTTNHSIQLFFGRIEDGKLERKSLTPRSYRAGEPAGAWDQGGNLHLVWTDSLSGPSQVYYAKVTSTGEVSDTVRLDVDKSSSFRPVISLDEEGHRFVYWLEAGPSGRYQLSGINTRFPRENSLWTQMGVDRENPAAHLVFSMLGNAFMASLLIIANFGLIVLGLLFALAMKWLRLVRDFNRYRWAWVTALGAFLWFLQATPIFIASPAPYGPLMDMLAAVLATLAAMLTLYLVRVDWNEGLARLAVIAIWLWCSIFFLRIPESLFV